MPHLAKSNFQRHRLWRSDMQTRPSSLTTRQSHKHIHPSYSSISHGRATDDNKSTFNLSSSFSQSNGGRTHTHVRKTTFSSSSTTISSPSMSSEPDHSDCAASHHVLVSVDPVVLPCNNMGVRDVIGPRLTMLHQDWPLSVSV